MNLLEHRAKEVFKRYNIPVPRSVLVSKPREVPIEFPLAVKAQVPVGGRGKAGGIRFAEGKEQLFTAIKQILGMKIRGFQVEKVLIEEKLLVEEEIFLSVAVDRSTKAPVLLASREGGVEVEEVPEDKIHKHQINPLVGLPPSTVREVVNKLGLSREKSKEIAGIASKLYKLFWEQDAELAEINPLILTTDSGVVAGDAKLRIDDDALYRHVEYQVVERDRPSLEQRASSCGIAFVKLVGNIGVIANGAGLTMATLDLLNYYGGKPGVFLDLGGGATMSRVKEALSLIHQVNLKVLLINIFGGITRCDEIALAVREVFEKEDIKIPIVARIKGTKEKEAQKILKATELTTADTLEQAIEKAVRISKV